MHFRYDAHAFGSWFIVVDTNGDSIMNTFEKKIFRFGFILTASLAAIVLILLCNSTLRYVETRRNIGRVVIKQPSDVFVPTTYLSIIDYRAPRPHPWSLPQPIPFGEVDVGDWPLRLDKIFWTKRGNVMVVRSSTYGGERCVAYDFDKHQSFYVSDLSSYVDSHGGEGSIILLDSDDFWRRARSSYPWELFKD